MQAAVVSLFPDVIESALAAGVTGRALRNLKLRCANGQPPRFHRRRPATPWTTGPSVADPEMVMMVDPLKRALGAAKALGPRVCAGGLPDPAGRALRISGSPRNWAALPGFRARRRPLRGSRRAVRRDRNRPASCPIGDYVLSGGRNWLRWWFSTQSPRTLPGVLGNPDSAALDSYMDDLLDCPHYTRPEIVGGVSAPSVLLSGDHGAVAAWRRREALGRTWQRRPEMLLDRELNAADRTLLADYIEKSRLNTLTEDAHAPQ